MPVEVNGDNALGPTCDTPFQQRRINTICIGVDIYKYGLRSYVSNGIRRRNVGQGRHQNFVACTNIERQQSQVQSYRAVADSNRVASPDHLSKLALETIDEFA